MNKIAVWGGGIIAMLMAIVLKKQNYDVALWRQAKSNASNNNQRVFALTSNSLDFLKSIGVWARYPCHAAQAVHQMIIWDGVGNTQLEFDSAEIAKSELAKIVQETALWEACYQELLAQKIPVYEVQSAEQCYHGQDKWHLDVAGGRLLSADVLFIADGAKSVVRDNLKISCKKDSYKQQGLVALVRVSKPHQGRALQIFGIHGPLAFLPLADQYYYSMVWSLDDELAQNYLGLAERGFCDKLQAYWDGYVGDIESVEGLQAYPLHYLHADNYYGENWVLVGDAAHHFHPLAGLGLNVGLADIICLQRLWQNNELNASLSKYQRERRAKIQPLLQMINLIKNSFAINDLIWIKLRNLGIGWINNHVFLKKVMMTMVQSI